eukprot:c32241_g1_i1.p1 GENE.c32241_g1_i1~~c32241_g1_i1.p1  ORF type:complete len:579 (+),score=78.93 c32241_g1_i1:46-1782(+)
MGLWSVVFLVVVAVCLGPAAASEKHTIIRTESEYNVRMAPIPHKTKHSARNSFLAAAAGAGIGALLSTSGDDKAPSETVLHRAAVGGLAGFAAHELFRSFNVPTKRVEDVPELETPSTTHKHYGVIGPLGRSSAVVYMANLNGNWDAFIDTVQKSDFLDFDGKNLILRPKTYLIITGNMVGGAGTAEIVKSLLNLKAKNENRVFWVLGSKDIQYLALASELSEAKVNSATDEGYNEACTEKTLACRLKYLLNLWGLSVGTEVDEEHSKPDFPTFVMDSLRGPRAWFFEYVDKGFLAFRIYDSLFVSGALTRASVGFSPSGQFFDKLDDWVVDLNTWKEHQCLEYLKSPEYIGRDEVEPEQTRGGDPLFKYADTDNPRSVVSASWFSATGERRGISGHVTKWLASNGISRVFTAADIVGVVPTVIRLPSLDGDMFILVSNLDYREGASATGLPISLVTIGHDFVHVKGTLPSCKEGTFFEGECAPADKCSVQGGQKHEYKILTEDDANRMDSKVGHRVKTNVKFAYVKTVLVHVTCDELQCTPDARSQQRAYLLEKSTGVGATPFEYSIGGPDTVHLDM